MRPFACSIAVGSVMIFWTATAPCARAADVAANLLRHIQVLASDEFEGRAPGTHGEELAVNYIVQHFKKCGLEPGNADGTYIQPVPLVGFTAQQPLFSYVVGEKKTALEFPGDCVIWSKTGQPDVRVENSEMVFVGYGVVAPEYDWDDYKGVDVRGKTIVMLINDPAIPDPQDPSKLDDKMFKGKAMTYYGRWTYKYEIALKKGAAAAIIVHETGPASYPFAVVVGSNSRENFELEGAAHIPVEGWITLGVAKKLIGDAGKHFDDLKKAALRKDFRPVALDVKASFQIHSSIRKISSRNVIAKLPGTDPQLKNQFVIYTAHWDHLGRDPKLSGDQIYNGALDNASGTAALLELAEQFSQAKARPRRSILFLSVTAEEKGLLGAAHYTVHPVYPLSQTVANLNIDGINVWGRTRDVENIPMGNSTLDDLLIAAAKKQNRVVKGDSTSDKGTVFRSDHFEFMKAGIPAVYLKHGNEFINKPPGFGTRKLEDYIGKDYHKPSDEIKPDWDLSGAVEDLELLFQVGEATANSPGTPKWKPGSEFNSPVRK
jgi:Zn-dependent M28 family amino/carboxypeptidase